MAMKTEGTDVYVIDPTDNTLIDIGCATGISGFGSTRTQIDTTCLQDIGQTSIAGQIQASEGTISIQFDTSNENHIKLYNLYLSGETAHWAIGLSDGIGIAPTVGTDGDFDLPETRSWITFDGYISGFPFDISLNAVITDDMTIQPSLVPVVVPKEVVSA